MTFLWPSSNSSSPDDADDYAADWFTEAERLVVMVREGHRIAECPCCAGRGYVFETSKRTRL